MQIGYWTRARTSRGGSGRAVSRILSAPLARRRGSFVCAASTRDALRLRGTEAGRFAVPYLALHPMGFSVPRRLRAERWALTPPFHPYPAEAGRFVFCGTVRRDASRHRRPRVSQPNKPELRGIAPCGVRTFLPRTARAARERPSALPEPLPRYTGHAGATSAEPGETTEKGKPLGQASSVYGLASGTDE